MFDRIARARANEFCVSESHPTILIVAASSACTGKDRMAPDEVVTPDEPSARPPQRTPAAAGAAVAVPPENNAVQDPLGVALSRLLQLALDAQAERSRSAPAQRQTAVHRVEISPAPAAISTTAERQTALSTIATLVVESARLDAARPDQVVHSLRALWSRVPQPQAVTLDEWDLVYHRILGRCLQEFYAGP
jgi:hypothetical protein